MAGIQTDSQPDSSGYRIRLKKISDELAKRDMAELKFLCSDLIPISTLEKINKGIGIMQELENRRMICPSDCRLLAELLFRVGRKDIVKRHMGTDPLIVEQRCGQESVLSQFRILLHKIAVQIPQKLLDTLKFLMKEDFSARSLELATDVYGLFKLLEAQEVVAEDNIDKLYEITRAIDRSDLIIHLDEYRTSRTFGSPRSKPHFPEAADDIMKRHDQPYFARELLGQPSYDRRPIESQSASQVGSLAERHVGIQSGNQRRIQGRNSFEENISTPVQASDDTTAPWHLAGTVTSGQPMISITGGLQGTRSYQPRSESLTVETSGGSEEAQQVGECKTWQDTARFQTGSQAHQSRRTELNREGLVCAAQSNEEPGTFGDLPEYKMSSNPRGFCIIINNDDFRHDPADKESKKLDRRPGTKKDEEKLEQLFKLLGFKVDIYRDLTVKKMKKTLSLASKLDHKTKDALVVCILSHGALGCVYGTDGHKLNISHILRLFNVTECPHLAGKPKIFYIAACQGMDRSAVPTKVQRDGDLVTDTANDADFLVGFATIPGFVSYRHEDEGTWYIQTLVKELKQHCRHHDLLSIMTAVNHGVLEQSAPGNHGKKYKQVTLPYTTLTKKIYLRPV